MKSLYYCIENIINSFRLMNMLIIFTMVWLQGCIEMSKLINKHKIC